MRGGFFKTLSLLVMKRIYFLSILALSTAAAFAQDSTQVAPSKPQVKLSVNYNSGLNYYGRVDSLKSSGVFPMLEFWASPNFYINAAPIFVNNKVQSFDYTGTVATIGYQHVSDKWISNVYALKPFYKSGTDLAQSVLKAQTGINISKLNKVLNFSLGGDIKFTDKTDFGATAGVDHIIRIQNKDNSVLVFDPAFYTYAGTQRFSRVAKKSNTNPLPLPTPNNNTQTENVNEFNILAYEASMPIIFAKNKWMVLVTPSYIIPQNLVTVPNRPDLSERGENTFYTTVGLKYSF